MTRSGDLALQNHTHLGSRGDSVPHHLWASYFTSLNFTVFPKTYLIAELKIIWAKQQSHGHFPDVGHYFHQVFSNEDTGQHLACNVAGQTPASTMECERGLGSSILPTSVLVCQKAPRFSALQIKALTNKLQLSITDFNAIKIKKKRNFCLNDLI